MNAARPRAVPAALLLGAAAIHFAVAPEHLMEYPLYGAFFFAVGAFQAGLAMALLQAPSRAPAMAGAVSSVGLIALWAVSRSSGLPIAPVPWRPEAVGLTDVACCALEAVAAGLLLRAVTAPGSAPGRPAGSGRWRTPSAPPPRSR